MVVKRVTIQIVGDDTQLKRMLDEIEKRKLELNNSPIRIGFNANGTRQASMDMDRLRLQLDQLNRKAINIKIDDSKAKADLENLRRTLHDVNGNWRAHLSVADYEKTKLQLDEIDRKLKEIRRNDDRIRLGGLIGGGGGPGFRRWAGGILKGQQVPGGGSTGGLLGSLIPGNPAALGGIGSLAALIGSLIPAAGGLLTGMGVGGLGIMLGLKLNPNDMKGFKNDLHQVLAPIAAATKPLIGGLFSAMGPLAQFMKAEGPQLKGMFSAAIPFIKMFVDLMEKSGKVLIPAFTQTMKEMTPYLPEMEKALIQIVKALGYFLKDLGPGMKDSSTIWLAMAIALKGLMIGLAAIVNALAHAFVWFGHQVNNGIKGAVEAWQWLVRTSKTAWHDVSGFASSLWHDIVKAFDSIRSGVSRVWDALWADIKSVAQSTIGWIEGAIGGLGKILSGIGNFFGGGSSGAVPHGIGGYPRSTGGYVPGTGSPNVDSTLIFAAPGERVLSHTEISGVGGPRVVDALFGNARAGSGSSFSSGGWVNHMMHRVREEIMYPGGNETGPRWTSNLAQHSTHVTVNMNGIVTNPQTVAREIQTMLLNLKQSRGGRDLGLA